MRWRRTDTLAGASGANSLYGGRGDDTLIADAGDDRLDGCPGIDVISYVSANAAIEADLSSGVSSGLGAFGTDALISIEGGGGSGGNDIFVYAAGDGDDTITDFAAGDTINLSGVTFANTGASTNIAVLSNGHTLTAQAGISGPPAISSSRARPAGQTDDAIPR